MGYNLFFSLPIPLSLRPCRDLFEPERGGWWCLLPPGEREPILGDGLTNSSFFSSQSVEHLLYAGHTAVNTRSLTSWNVHFRLTDKSKILGDVRKRALGSRWDSG